MFVAFILQIIFRYLLNFPVGWTNEISVVLWIWLLLWGAAFVLRDEEEIRFDLIYAGAGPRLRRGMFLASAVALVGLYGYSFPAVFDYVTFMKVEKTAYLGLRSEERPVGQQCVIMCRSRWSPSSLTKITNNTI